MFSYNFTGYVYETLFIVSSNHFVHIGTMILLMDSIVRSVP